MNRAFAYYELCDKDKVQTFDNDPPERLVDTRCMGKKRNGPGWYAAEWLQFRGLKQADVVRASEMGKSEVSEYVNGVRRYNEDVLADFARVLRCTPGMLIDVNPLTVDGTIINLWDDIPPEQRDQAVRILRALKRPG